MAAIRTLTWRFPVEGPDGTIFGGHVSRWTVPDCQPSDRGAGYQHFSLAGSNSVPGNGGTALDPTASTFRIAFGARAFLTALNNDPETIDMDNLQILMNTNPPPPPPPVMDIAKTTPALRVFEQNSDFNYNQSGFGTVDSNQSWLGSTPTNPTSYKINIANFPSVPSIRRSTCSSFQLVWSTRSSFSASQMPWCGESGYQPLGFLTSGLPGKPTRRTMVDNRIFPWPTRSVPTPMVLAPGH